MVDIESKGKNTTEQSFQRGDERERDGDGGGCGRRGRGLREGLGLPTGC